MNNTKLIRIFSLSLRILTMASKFLLVFLLARFLAPAELGVFGLLSATIGYALYLLGFDFYTFTTREIAKHDMSQWGGLLKCQAAISLLLYLIVLPLLTLIFIEGLLPWRFAGWFFLLIVIEHLTQELGRLLIAISEPLIASVILFLRQGIWAIAIVALMLLAPETRSLDYVLGGWSLGGLCGLALGLHRLWRLKLGGWHRRIDWAWIGRGLKVAASLLIATLAIRGVLTLDRYWLQILSGAEVLAAYVLYMNIGNALMSFLDAGVFSFTYPAMVNAWQKGNMIEFNKALANLTRQTSIVSGSFFIAALLLISPLLQWLGKDIYITHRNMFPWILAATTVYGLGMIPHYALYAVGRDRSIITCHLLTLPLFILLVWILSAYDKNLAVAISLFASFLFILIWKFTAFALIKNNLTTRSYTNSAKA
ncbi:Membrane protein involved in the export of O-antigen and teichoic acid [Pseudomonas panipatensis]|uniref:Membrane protein involved in the export of O-antigen and teichoic acid n=2 Tax=Pseudomonas panipatensis TaxID=428992 RepID=A0A1G8DLN5_9PSED|nr:Membrane protein involved in the export of O-antigen and teichoic acid [Pseudomonas panipatensis]SMP40938.1 Membrane protein involved in the export of O-antigen and teichoic acid [Pseudomonas panipatensis]